MLPISPTPAAAIASLPISGSATNDPPSENSKIIDILSSLQSSMARMEGRIVDLETEVPDSITTADVVGGGGIISEGLPIPTMDTLRSSADIQREVQARLAQITEGICTGSDLSRFDSKPIKSGRNRGPETSAKHHVTWPHELVYVGASRTTADYDNLTPVQFITGFLRSLQLAPPNDRDHILSYGIDLFQDAVDVNWEVARGANAVILQEIEQGRLTWSDSEKLNRTRTLYTQRAQVTNNNVNVTYNGGEDAVSTRTKIVCHYYNIGRCNKENNHVTSGTTYRHICSHCFKVSKKAVEHPEHKCNVKKNGKN